MDCKDLDSKRIETVEDLVNLGSQLNGGINYCVDVHALRIQEQGVALQSKLSGTEVVYLYQMSFDERSMLEWQCCVLYSEGVRDEKIVKEGRLPLKEVLSHTKMLVTLDCKMVYNGQMMNLIHALGWQGVSNTEDMSGYLAPEDANNILQRLVVKVVNLTSRHTY